MPFSNDLTLKVGFDVKKFAGDLSRASNEFSSFSSKIGKFAKFAGVSFAVKEVGQFVLGVSKLSGEATAVSAAFAKLGNSQKLMNELKVATAGTVSELELMKRSVMASNFDISLKALPQLLEFASVRAKQTGQSVDYLVDSIVTGIGRKSKLILDNLGISAVQLEEALGGASTASSTIGQVAEAVGKIAAKELARMGHMSEDASTKADRLAASWDNLKVSIGDLVNNIGLPKVFQGITYVFNGINNIFKPFGKNYAELVRLIDVFNKTAGPGGPTGKSMQVLQQRADALGISLERLGNGFVRIAETMGPKKQEPFKWLNPNLRVVETVGMLRDKIKQLNEDIEASGSRSHIAKYQAEIVELEKKIDALLGKQKKIATIGELIIPKLAKPKGPEASFGLQSTIGIDLKDIDKQTETLDRARKTINDFGLTTQKSLDLAARAYADFVKNGNAEVFNKTIQDIASNEQQMVNLAADIGNSFGTELGNAISGMKSFAKSFGDFSKSIINNIEQIVLARIMANSSKFGIAGIVAAAAGFGVVKSLFNSIGENKNSMAVGASRNNLGNVQLQRDLNASGMNLVARVSGRDLEFVLAGQSTYNNRTKI